MSYQQWADAFSKLYESMPDVTEPASKEFEYIEILWQLGFCITSSEAETMGITKADYEAIRREFFDYNGLDPTDFD